MIRTARNNTCASCEKYPLQKSVGAGGVAECRIWAKPMAWNDPACVLHDAAPDRKHRAAFVIQLMQDQKKRGEDGKE